MQLEVTIPSYDLSYDEVLKRIEEILSFKIESNELPHPLRRANNEDSDPIDVDFGKGVFFASERSHYNLFSIEFSPQELFVEPVKNEFKSVVVQKSITFPGNISYPSDDIQVIPMEDYFGYIFKREGSSMSFVSQQRPCAPEKYFKHARKNPPCIDVYIKPEVHASIMEALKIILSYYCQLKVKFPKTQYIGKHIYKK